MSAEQQAPQTAISQYAGNSTQDYCTPPHIVRAAERDTLGRPFALDAFAEPHNAVAKKFYALPKHDGFFDPWTDGTFANPPYSEQERALARGAYFGSLDMHSAVLVKVDTSALYWRRLVFERGMLDLYEGRIAFLAPPSGITKTNKKTGKVRVYQHGDVVSGTSFASALVWYGPRVHVGAVRYRSASTGELVVPGRYESRDLFLIHKQPKAARKRRGAK